MDEKLKKDIAEVQRVADLLTETQPSWSASLKSVAAVASQTEDCICKGNWRDIVKEYQPFFGRKYRCNWGPDGSREYTYVFFGIVHAEDDYYYGMMEEGTGKMRLLSCVGSIEGFNFEPILKNEPCEHKRSIWSGNMKHGTCKDCGAKLP